MVSRTRALLKSFRNLVWKEVNEFFTTMGRGFLASCMTLLALVVADSLLLLSTDYVWYAYAAGAVVMAIRVFSRNRRWGPAFNRLVLGSVSWMFGAMGFLILEVGAQPQLGVFDASGLSAHNSWVAVFLVLAILLPAPLFALANNAEDAEETIRKMHEKQRISSIFYDPEET